MLKSEVVMKVAEKTGLKKDEAEKAVNAVLATIEEALQVGEKVVFTGFGSFDVAERSARTGRNPQTGAELKIAASKAPRFKAGKGLKNAVA